MDFSEKARPFGDDYTPKAHYTKVVNGRLYGGKTHELPVGKGKQLPFAQFNIALFNVDGQFYAVKDACPHAGYPLSKSVITGRVVACSSHNWQFDVMTGECLRAEEEGCPGIRSFPVTIENEDIWITL